MEFLRRLLGIYNPTAKWAAQLPDDLVFNLDRGELHTAKLAQPLDALSFLGKAEPMLRWCNDVSGNLNYPDLGFQVFYEERRIESYLARLGAWQAEPGVKSFRGLIEYQGHRCRPADWADEAAVIDAIGKPYWRDEDEYEVILFYVNGDFGWEVEIPTGEPPESLHLGTPSPLDDEEFRRDYQINKPWPPTPSR